MTEHEAQRGSNTPALVGQALVAQLRGAAALAARMQQFDPGRIGLENSFRHRTECLAGLVVRVRVQFHSVVDCPQRRLSASAHIELGEDAPQMRFRRADAQNEVLGDVLVVWPWANWHRASLMGASYKT